MSEIEIKVRGEGPRFGVFLAPEFFQLMLRSKGIDGFFEYILMVTSFISFEAKKTPIFVNFMFEEGIVLPVPINYFLTEEQCKKGEGEYSMNDYKYYSNMIGNFEEVVQRVKFIKET